MASSGHSATHSPQPMHRGSSTTACSLTRIAPVAQTSSHIPHAVHLSVSITA